MVTIGNTVRITATYRDWDGDPADPVTAKFTIYSGERATKEEVDLDMVADRVGVGVYRRFYTVTGAGPGPLHIEAQGVDSDGRPIVGRVQVSRSWV